MKRITTVVLSLAIVGMVVGSADARQRFSEQTQEYGPTPNVVGADTDLPGFVMGEVLFEPGRATSMKIAVEDAAAPATIAVVRQMDTVLATVCTASDAPIDIVPRTPVVVTLYAGACENTPSFVTSGSVRATFSGR